GGIGLRLAGGRDLVDGQVGMLAAQRHDLRRAGTGGLLFGLAGLTLKTGLLLLGLARQTGLAFGLGLLLRIAHAALHLGLGLAQRGPFVDLRLHGALRRAQAQVHFGLDRRALGLGRGKALVELLFGG